MLQFYSKKEKVLYIYILSSTSGSLSYSYLHQDLYTKDVYCSIICNRKNKKTIKGLIIGD